MLLFSWLLFFACETSVVEADDTAGGGDNNGDSDTNADSDTDNDTGEDSDTTSDSDTSTDSDSSVSDTGTGGPADERIAFVRHTGQHITSGDHLTVALIIGDFGAGTGCSGGTGVLELGDSVQMGPANVTEATYVVTETEEPELADFMSCINNGVDDPTGTLARGPSEQSTNWNAGGTESAAGLDALIGRDLSSLHVVHESVSTSNVGSTIYTYTVRFEFWGPAQP